MQERAWAVAPRLPLGDPYAGECRAGACPTSPDHATLRAFCNVGYGRGECTRFPQSGEADAVRFHVLEQQGGLLRIQFVFEKACWPLRDGVVEYANGLGSGADPILDRQAAVFAQSYLRRCL